MKDERICPNPYCFKGTTQRTMGNMIDDGVDRPCSVCNGHGKIWVKSLTQNPTQTAEDIIEQCAKIADERARYMNILGSDANMTRKMTHAEIQAERVWEAREIARLIRASRPAPSERKSAEATLGIGEGDGNMFVHGDYESIKHLQKKIFRMEALERVAKLTRKILDCMYEFCEKNCSGANACHEYTDYLEGALSKLESRAERGEE